jgi:hypothetical protein
MGLGFVIKMECSDSNTSCVDLYRIYLMIHTGGRIIRVMECNLTLALH